jgi:Zn-dependent protease with chaperone function
MRFARLLAVALFVSSLIAGSAAAKAQNTPVPAPQEKQMITAQQQAPDQAYHLPSDKQAKAKTLNKIRLTLDIAGSVWGLAVIWLLLATRTAAGLERWAAHRSGRRWIQGVWFFAAFIVITFLASLPLDMIGHTVSRHYGISVQGWAGWFGDQGKSLGLSLIFGWLGLLLFNWIVKVSPRRFWLWCWVVAVPLSVAGTIGEPLLEPIYNQFEPLTTHNAALVADLEKVVARTGTNIPPDRMYLMKASVKTNGLNAYVSGLGATKRIVVWDTTAGRVPNDEVMYIFGHETGHYVLHHIPKGLAASAVGMFFLFWACAGFSKWLVTRHGERWGIHAQVGPKGEIAPLATRAGFVVLLFAVSIAGFILTPVSNTVSRYFEHQADVYGQEAMHGLVHDPQRTAVAAFNALGEAWLEDPDPSPIVEFWLYNHPSVKNRANFAARYDPWANGGHGEFFKQ